MKLITSWKKSLKFWSNRIMLAAGSLPVAWLGLPEDWKQAVTQWGDGILMLGASALALMSFFARNVKQEKLHEQNAGSTEAASEGEAS